MESVIESDGGCREDKDGTNGTDSDVDNTNESEDEVPIFLRPEFYDIFPTFASTLDIKSFIKLAMTSKDMYKLCTEDKSLRIKMTRVEVDADFYFYPIDRHKDSFVRALGKFKFKINIGMVDIKEGMRDCAFISTVGQNLKGLGVNRINCLKFPYYYQLLCLHNDPGVCEAFLTFIKDFKVHYISVDDTSGAELPYLSSMLKLNVNCLSFYNYGGPQFLVEFLLENSSKIPKVSFVMMERFSRDQFTELLSKIQDGSYLYLSIPSHAVDWSIYDKLPFDHEGPLPDERPLLFVRSCPQKHMDEYWFLHENGCYTKCVVKPSDQDLTLEIFKCDPCDFPSILPKEEDILKDLVERHPTVYCSARLFHKYTACLTFVDSSQEDPLPKERPLYFKISENHIWMLDENDDLMSCTWDAGCAVWEAAYITEPTAYPALVKYKFWKLIKSKEHAYEFLYCKSAEEFSSWFEGLKTLSLESFKYDLSPLPTERPVVFESLCPSVAPCSRVVLFQDYCVECELFRHKAVISRRPYTCRSWLLKTSEIVNMLQSAIKWSERLEKDREGKVFVAGYGDLRVDLQIFRDGFNLFETFPLNYFLPQQHILVYAKTTKNSDGEVIEERFFATLRQFLKATWEKGRLMVSPANLCDTPLEFTKQCFKLFAQKQSSVRQYLELDQFNSCLEQFTIVPFDYAGPLKRDSPLAFMKNEIRHTCPRYPSSNVLCQCSETFINAWILWDDMQTTHCSWALREPKRVLFGMPYGYVGVPSALKSMEYLNILLQCKYYKQTMHRWYGSFEYFRACLSDFKTLPLDYDAPLPEERPLLFYDGSDWTRSLRIGFFPTSSTNLCCFVLREDGTVIKCACKRSYIALYLPSSDNSLPPALMSLL